MHFCGGKECVGEVVGVGVCPHIPHLAKAALCTKVYTVQGKVIFWILMGGGGGSFSPPNIHRARPR